MSDEFGKYMEEALELYREVWQELADSDESNYDDLLDKLIDFEDQLGIAMPNMIRMWVHGEWPRDDQRWRDWYNTFIDLLTCKEVCEAFGISMLPF